MKKPYKYFILCDKTLKLLKQTNQEPITSDLQTWESTDDPNIKERKQTKTAYIDTRYKAKLRLYNYVTYTKQGLSVPTYKPLFTQMGLNEPILNF